MKLPIRVLVLCDDFWHPAGIPKQGLGLLEKQGFEFTWLENANEFKAELLAKFSVLILTKSNNVSSADQAGWVNEQLEVAIKSYIQKGNGLLVIHSGLAGYQEAKIIRAVTGGIFTKHPPQCPVTVNPEVEHPLTEGVEAFTLTDEHYFIDLDDRNVKVFLTTTSEHGSQPGGWTRVEGDGRVCAITPGHNLQVWHHPSFQKLLFNGLHWCSGQ